MKLTNENENYSATVIEITSLRGLDGLDNLMGIPVFGETALVSKDHEIGELGIVFTAETQLSEDFVKRNNLYRKSEFNDDPLKTGYLEINRRVKAIRLRGNISSALFLPLECLEYLGVKPEDLKVGDSFTHINGIEVCRKYVIKTPQSKFNKIKGKNKKFEIISARTFPEHYDTYNYWRNSKFFRDNDEVVVTQKLHGCVSGDTLVETENGVQRIDDVVNKKNAKTVKAFDISSKKEVFAPIGEYFFKPNDGEWYEIELENGKKINITGNNPVWLPDLGVYRRVDDLKGDENLLIDDI